MKSRRVCAIPLFSLYMYLAGCPCRSIVVVCYIVAYSSSDWKKKRGRRKKKAKKKLRDASIQYGERKKRRE